MSGRTYLSIGDVLTLLRQEFPDVTISKIRFLESQGLVNPERTPSGYRKFYEQDVERLRWVLRQQRENFLPLKVIKGRLEQEGGVDAVDDLDDPDFDADADFDDEATDRADYAEQTAEIRDRSEGAELRRRPVPVLVGQGAPLAPAAAARPTSGSLPGFESAAPAPVGEAEMAAATFVDGADEAGGDNGAADDMAAKAEAPAPAPAAPGRRAAASRPAGGRSASKSPASGPAPKATGVAAAGTEPPVATMSGNDMTIEELASAAGLTVGDVQQLVSFGLLAGRLVGGVAYFDDDALAIGRAAAGFARYGVEARHLRLHKLAAEREAGFIEQIVLPLLKQRNPEARQRAHDNVTELTRLGQQLRTVLLRNALRDQLGG